jgi:hypothetical protein
MLRFENSKLHRRGWELYLLLLLLYKESKSKTQCKT